MTPKLDSEKKNTILTDICIYGLLTISILIGYFQVIDYEFINYDDNQYITENPNIYEGITLKSLQWAFTSKYAANWHPLTWISHMIDVKLFGMNAGMHHLMNVLIHIANTLLLFYVLQHISANRWSSAFVAFLFAIHPLHIQSVAWVSERKDVLSTLFWMFTLLYYAKYVTTPCIRNYLMIILCYLLGLLSKPMLVTLPFVLLLLDYWPLGRFQIQSHSIHHFLDLVKEKIPLFILSILSSIITFIAQKESGAVVQVDTIPLDLRIVNALNSYVMYIVKTIYPHNFSIFYPYSSEIPFWVTVGNILLLVTITFLSIIRVKKYPFISVGWFWYLGTCFPVIGIVQVGGQAMADRYTYIPLIGIFIGIAWGIPCWVARFHYRKYLLTGCFIATVGVLLPITHTEVKYWKNSITLFERAIQVTKDNYVAHENLGSAYLEIGNEDKAIFHIHELLKLKPNHWEAFSNLGVAYCRKKEFDKAFRYLEYALNKNPSSDLANNNMGILMKEMNRHEEAIQFFNKAIQLNPNSSNSYINLGTLYFEQRKYSDAIDMFLAAMKIKPYHPEPYFKLANTYAELGNYHEAIQYFKISLQLNPSDADVHNNLGVAYANKGDYPNAIVHFKEAVRIQPNPVFIQNLNQLLSQMRQ